MARRGHSASAVPARSVSDPATSSKIADMSGLAGRALQGTCGNDPDVRGYTDVILQCDGQTRSLGRVFLDRQIAARFDQNSNVIETIRSGDLDFIVWRQTLAAQDQFFDL